MKSLNLKKNFLTSIAVFAVLAPAQSFALENIAKVGGLLEVQGIYYDTFNKLHDQRVSPYRHKIGLASSGDFFVDYKLADDNGLKYGTKIGLEHTNKNDNSVPLSIYVESCLGKIEGGSDKAAGGKMRITGYTGAVAAGGSWDSIFTGKPTGTDGLDFVSGFSGFLDSKTRPSGRVELSRKITYYTPKINLNEDHNLQFGISYIPDASNNGADKTIREKNPSKISDSPNKSKFTLKDGFSGGLTYEGKFSESLSTKLSLVAETAEARLFDNNDKSSDTKLKKVNTYTIGTETKYDKVSFSASYMNYNKSVTSSKDPLGRSTYLYGFGLKYSFDKYAIGVNQFNSSYKKNKLGASSIGAEYDIATGLKAYAQYVYYRSNGRYIKIDETNNVATTKTEKGSGNIVLIGAKLSI